MDRFRREPSVFAQQQRLANLLVWPLEMMLRSQANMASAIQDAFSTFTRLMHCRDIGEAYAIQQEWFNNHLRRFGGAFQSLAEEAAQQTTRASHDAASVTQEDVSQALGAVREPTQSVAAHTMQPETRRAAHPASHPRQAPRPGGRRQARKSPRQQKKSGKQQRSRKRRAG
jgi:hypothetical protein